MKLEIGIFVFGVNEEILKVRERTREKKEREREREERERSLFLVGVCSARRFAPCFAFVVAM